MPNQLSESALSAACVAIRYRKRLAAPFGGDVHRVSPAFRSHLELSCGVSVASRVKAAEHAESRSVNVIRTLLLWSVFFGASPAGAEN
jgi:hypothetical protein